MFQHRFACLCLLFSICVSSVIAQDVQYGLVIDAGSTGSRIYIYKWDHTPGETPRVEEIIVKDPAVGKQSVNPGVSSFAADPPKVAESLQPLIDFAAHYVPKSAHSSSHLYLAATAGMRLLEVDDRERVMAQIRNFFKTKCPFKFEDVNARVISGEEEGVYGWIQLNYAFNKIGKDSRNGDGVTYAALDLGGASNQITFQPSQDIMAHIFPVVFDKKVYRLYTHSFLNFGMDRALARSYEKQYEDNKQPAVLKDPCFLEGFSETVEILGKQVKVEGTSDPAACREVSKNLLFVDTPCMNEPCSVQGVYQPSISGKTYAMSSYYYYVALLGLTDETETWQGSVKDLEKVAQDFCKLSWDDAQKKYPKASASYLKSYCFRGSYIIALLNDGFHYPPTEKSLVFSNKVENTQMGWTLGLLLYQIQLVPVSLPSAENCDVVTAASQSGNTVYAVGVPVVALLGGLYLGWFVAKRSLLQSPKRVRGRDEKPLLSGYNV